MIREHTISVFSNTNFGCKVMKMWHFSKLITRLRYPVQFEVYFEIFYKKISYDPFIILIMCYNIWGINFDYMTCYSTFCIPLDTSPITI